MPNAYSPKKYPIKAPPKILTKKVIAKLIDFSYSLAMLSVKAASESCCPNRFVFWLLPLGSLVFVSLLYSLAKIVIKIYWKGLPTCLSRSFSRSLFTLGS